MHVKEPEKKPIIIFGAGRCGKMCFDKFEDEVYCFADNYKAGQIYCGKPIISFDELCQIHQDYNVIPATFDNNEIIIEQCNSAGITPTYRYRLGCRSLQDDLIVEIKNMYTCCSSKHERFSLELSGNWKNDCRLLMEYKQTIIDKMIKNEPNDCDGCSFIHHDFYCDNPELKCFNIAGGRGEHCNCKCIYCNVPKLNAFTDFGEYTFMEPLYAFEDYITKDTLIMSGGSEITVSPYKQEYFNFIRRNQCYTKFLTSGVLFSEDIANLLKNDARNSLCVSLDSGTREIYERIKRVDAFDAVVANLTKYRIFSSNITLKYIIIEDINDNENEIDSFFEIAKSIANNLMITVEYSCPDSGSDKILALIEYFFNKAHETGIFAHSYAKSFDQSTLVKVNDIRKKLMYSKVNNKVEFIR